MHFDTDSYDILVDNCCSQSITNNLQDYIKPPKLSDMRIKGFNGTTTKTRVGTVRWRIHDDEGRIHCILLPNTYYSPHAESRLIKRCQLVRSIKGFPHGTLEGSEVGSLHGIA